MYTFFFFTFTPEKTENEHLGRLTVKEELSRDKDEIFLYVTTSPQDFEAVAEQIKMKKKLRLEFGGNIVIFARK